MDVLITGASGIVGSALRQRFPDTYSLTCLDISPDAGTLEADVADYDAIRPAFDGQDAVIHLAVQPLHSDEWPATLETNIVGTYNVLEAARDAAVPRLVFASSNHAVGLYEREHAPELYYGEVDLRLDETTQPRPDSLYGTSKAFGEALTCFYTGRYDHPVQSQAIRICTVQPPAYDHPYGSAERGVDEGSWERGSAAYELQVARQRAMWQSRRDCAQQFRRCLETESDGFDVLYGVSDNARRWVDLRHSTETVGYVPEDSADEWSAPPATDTTETDD